METLTKEEENSETIVRKLWKKKGRKLGNSEKQDGDPKKKRKETLIFFQSLK